MFCPKCGAQTPDDALFCSKCGAKLPTQVEDAEKPAAPELEEPTAPEVPAAPTTPAAEKPAPAPDAPKPPAADTPAAPAAPAQPAANAPRPPEGVARATGAPVPPMGAEAAPAYDATDAQADETSPTPPKKGKKGMVIGIVAAVVAFVAAFAIVRALAPSGPWTGSMMLEGVDSSATFDREFGIEFDGTTMTVYDQDDVISGTVASTSETDDEVFYELTDVDWGSWGTELFQSSTVRNKRLTVMVPKDARADSPYGRWGMVVAATDVADEDYPLFVRSTVLELTDDTSGRYEFSAEWGKSESDVGIADPTSSYYDPAASGWDRRVIVSGSRGNYQAEILDDTFTLTFK